MDTVHQRVKLTCVEVCEEQLKSFTDLDFTCLKICSLKKNLKELGLLHFSAKQIQEQCIFEGGVMIAGKWNKDKYFLR